MRSCSQLPLWVSRRSASVYRFVGAIRAIEFLPNFKFLPPHWRCTSSLTGKQILLANTNATARSHHPQHRNRTHLLRGLWTAQTAQQTIYICKGNVCVWLQLPTIRLCTKNGTKAVPGNAAKRRQLSFRNGDTRKIQEFFRRRRRIREQSMKVMNWNGLENVLLTGMVQKAND